MERKIDKVLSRVLPNGLPKYPSLPERWYLYPYGVSVFFCLVLFAISFLITKAVQDYHYNPMGVSIITTYYLLPLCVSFYYLLRANIRYWFHPISIPHTFEDYKNFAELINHKGNISQTILIHEYILHNFPNEDVSAIAADLGIAYLHKYEDNPLDVDKEKAILYLTKGLPTNDKNNRDDIIF